MTLLEAAVAYARRGWPVLPLHEVDGAGRCSCAAASCSQQGKHPRTAHGSKDARADEAAVRAWWRSWPTANIGIRTGPAAPGLVGLFVVGPDGPDGIAALTELQRHLGPLPATPTAATGSGGQHLYFRSPAGADLRNRRSHRGLPIDVRAAGGLVVAPPSRNARGPYAWECGPAVELAEAPDWLVAWCGPVERRPQPRPCSGEGRSTDEDVVRRAIRYLERMPPAVSGQGGHDRTLKAARVVVYGFDLGVARGLHLLAAHYNPRCRPPWSEKELRHKCAEADRVPFRKPRGWLLERSAPQISL